MPEVTVAEKLMREGRFALSLSVRKLLCGILVLTSGLAPEGMVANLTSWAHAYDLQQLQRALDIAQRFPELESTVRLRMAKVYQYMSQYEREVLHRAAVLRLADQTGLSKDSEGYLSAVSSYLIGMRNTEVISSPVVLS